MRIAFSPAISAVKPKTNSTSFLGTFWSESRKNIKNQQGIGKDTFTKEEVPQQEPDESYKFLGTEGKFRVADYDMVNPALRPYSRLGLDDDVRSAADRSAHLGFKLKRRLDRIYGKNNYVFVSIGVKPSLIAKTFEFQGAETRYLPTSNIKKWEQNLKGADLEAYKAFMASQGLSKEAMENSHKKYLFFDYTSGDNHLVEIEDFMINTVGLPKDKMEFRSLNRDLRDVNASEDTIEGYIDLYLTKGLAQKYSSIAYIPSCNFTKSTFIPEKLTRYTDSDVRKFTFLLMDSLNQAEALEETPENEDAL